jgi:hypothetical protein
VQASNPLSCPDRVILTVRDEGNANRQASAMVYLSRNRTPLAVALSQDELTQDKGLLVLVTLIGAMGALLGASRSLASYVGNDAFVPRWTLFYLFRPTFGAGLALLVFFGYRIGAISGVKGAAPANPFAAAFIAGLVGLFADTVLQKLKDVFTALFPTTPAQDQRKDTIAEPAASTPAIESVTSSAAQKRMTVKGKNFVAGAKVMLNGTERPTASTAPGELSVVLDPADAGDMKVVVINPDKQRSAEFQTRIGS